jgi:hypothetical protein
VSVRRLVASLATLLVSLLGLLQPAAAEGAPAHTAAAYTYDGHNDTAVQTHTATERGPPSTYDRVTAYNAADRRARVASARSDTTTQPLAGITYDDSVPLVQVAGVGTTTGQATQGTREASASLYPAGVAANAGPRALPVGPWGQRVMDARSKLPSSWGPGVPNSKKPGTRWFDPGARQSNGVRIDQGSPGSTYPSQQVDHVIVRSGGNVLGPDGLPITGSIKQNPQAHIPLDDWLSWTSWNAP